MIETVNKESVQFEDIRKEIMNITDKAIKAFKIVREAFCEIVDCIKMYVDMIKDACSYPTSFRYKIVKLISKCTGIDINNIWKATRSIWHTHAFSN